jgi:hypothetical protein
VIRLNDILKVTGTGPMNDAIDLIRKLEELAAWHRAIAERAGSPWVCEARLRAAEELERQAVDLRRSETTNIARSAKGLK